MWSVIVLFSLCTFCTSQYAKHLHRELSFSITLMPKWRQEVLGIIYVFIASSACRGRLAGFIVSNHTV